MKITAVGFGLNKESRAFIIKILNSTLPIGECGLDIVDLKSFACKIDNNRTYVVFGDAARRALPEDPLHACYLPDLDYLVKRRGNEEFRTIAAKALKELASPKKSVDKSVEDIEIISIKMKTGTVTVADTDADITNKEFEKFLNVLSKIPHEEINIAFNSNNAGQGACPDSDSERSEDD